MISNKIAVTSLGQSGFRFKFDDLTIYVDPYLSDNVESVSGELYKRQFPVWKSPDLIKDADWVLVTHEHLDHCDLETLAPLAQASPQCQFVGPKRVCEILRRAGIERSRLLLSADRWIELGKEVRVHPTPAAHPNIEIESDGGWRYAGYLLEYQERRIYHAGDTALTPELVEFIEKFKPIDTAVLPINEINFYRDQLGIVGNMGLRDAFKFAEELEVKCLLPMHWDMFIPNRVHREEIELLYKLCKPNFELLIYPKQI